MSEYGSNAIQILREAERVASTWREGSMGVLKSKSECDVVCVGDDEWIVHKEIAAALTALRAANALLREECRAWRQYAVCDPQVAGECQREAWECGARTDAAKCLEGGTKGGGDGTG